MSLAFPWALLLLPLPLLLRLLPLSRGSPATAALEVAPAVFAVARSAGRRADLARLLPAAGAWVALVLALTGPQMAVQSDAILASGREIMLALDLSGSMETEDFVLDGQPLSRLDAVKRVAAGFVAARRGDRIGLVIFGDRAYVAQPPTFDVGSVARAIETAQIGVSGRSTAISDGLGLATRRLMDSEAASKVIVLLSDGVDTTGKVQGTDAARLAASHGMRVHTIALGPEDFGSQPAARDGVDAIALRQMAELGGGTSFRVRSMADLVAMAASLDDLEPNPMRRPPLQIWQPLWIWPGGVALAFVLVLALRPPR